MVANRLRRCRRPRSAPSSAAIATRAVRSMIHLIVGSGQTGGSHLMPAPWEAELGLTRAAKAPPASSARAAAPSRGSSTGATTTTKLPAGRRHG